MRARAVRPYTSPWFDVPDDPYEQDDAVQNHHMDHPGTGTTAYVRLDDGHVEKWEVVIYETDTETASLLIHQGIHRVHAKHIKTEQEAMNELAKELDAPWLTNGYPMVAMTNTETTR